MADPNSTVIYDRLFPKISNSLNNINNVRKIQEFYGNVISNNVNSEALGMAVPYKSLFIHHKEELKYFEAIGLEKPEVMDAIHSSPHIPKDSWFTVKNDMYMSLLLVAIYFKNKKNDQMFTAMMRLWSLYMYKNVKSKYFNPRKTGENSLKCMEYTISRLSYKNDLKKYKSINETINKKTEVFIVNWFDNRNKELQGKITDEVLCNMINDNHRRYDTLFKNFFVEFKKDLDAGNYLNIDQDIDDGEEYMESDNVSFMVEKATQKIMNKFNNEVTPNMKLMMMVCSTKQIKECSINNLKNMYNYISNNPKKFEDVVRILIQVYLFDYKKKVEDLKTFDFIVDMLEYYRKQTVNDKNLTRLKVILEEVAMNAKPGGTTRKPTLNAWEKGFMMYVLYYIQYTMLGNTFGREGR